MGTERPSDRLRHIVASSDLSTEACWIIGVLACELDSMHARLEQLEAEALARMDDGK